MGQYERRQALLEVLCIRRQDTYDNLAHEFQVSKTTIRRDVAALMCSYPIETVCGRYGGGVHVADGFFLYRKSKTLSARQVALLIKLSAFLADDDLNTLNEIILQFTL